jgi:hypothetical protein
MNTALVIPHPQPDLAQAERFLTCLDEEAEFFTFQTFDDLKQRKDQSLAKILHGTLEQHHTDLGRLQWRRAGVYVTVNATDGKGRKLANMVKPRAIWCEWDRCGEALPQWPLDPQVVVESSPGKFHCYWFAWDLEWADFDLLMQVMVAWGSDKNAKDRARVLRLPGFWHQKSDPPWQVRIVVENERMPYSRDELLAAFPITSQPLELLPPPPTPEKEHHHWMSVVMRLAGEHGARTWSDLKTGRHNQIISLGHELASRGVPESYFDEALRAFERAMRPTNANGEVEGMNWNNERQAILHGYKTAAGKPTVAHGAQVAEALLKNQEQQSRQAAQAVQDERPGIPPFPAELLDLPPGPVRDYVDWVNATGPCVQPVLAIANALALWGVIIGRTAQTETGLRTNLYTLGIAPSGTGKDHARKRAKQLLHDAGLTERLGGENLASDSGLLDALHRSPACLFQIDELGRIFKTITKSDKAHLAGITTALLTLYSSADGLFLGKEYATQERKDIDQPCCGVYGTTVETHFFKALTQDEAEDGLLARILIFTGEADPDEQDVTPIPPPASLVATVQTLARRAINAQLQGNLDSLRPNPSRYIFTPAARALFAELKAWIKARRGDHQRRQISAIWNRCWENAAKVALILAASRLDGPEQIDQRDAQYGIALTRWCCDVMVACIAQYVGENEAETTSKRVERIIRQAGADGITLNQLYGKTRFLKKRERAEMLEDLEISHTIFRQSEKAQGQGDRAVLRFTHGAFAVNSSKQQVNSK